MVFDVRVAKDYFTNLSVNTDGYSYFIDPPYQILSPDVTSPLYLRQSVDWAHASGASLQLNTASAIGTVQILKAPAAIDRLNASSILVSDSPVDLRNIETQSLQVIDGGIASMTNSSLDFATAALGGGSVPGTLSMAGTLVRNAVNANDGANVKCVFSYNANLDPLLPDCSPSM